MKSKIDVELTVIKGTPILKSKEYPNWYGIPNIGFKYLGQTSDPKIEYKGKQFNSYIVEDTMWERYREDCENKRIKTSEDDFEEYMLSHKENVYELCEILLETEE